MTIEFVFNRVEPLIDKVTNNVISWIVGCTGTDSVTGTGAYIDTIKQVPEINLKLLASWTVDEIREFCIQVANENDWYVKLGAQIDSQIASPAKGDNVVV